MQSEFVHYLFDTVWRCCQQPVISEIADAIKSNKHSKALNLNKDRTFRAGSTTEKLEAVSKIVDLAKANHSKAIFLVESDLLGEFSQLTKDYFKKDIEELTELNINISSQKLQYSTPIKYRGLECEQVILVTSGITEASRIQNYVGATRAIYHLYFILWS
jgi:hypothetical protein